MSLEPGTRLGAYQIVSTIGAGGMGEVYRARDARLNRDVALKLLPATFAGDAERMGRFEREAQVLASLNHPNIASIYGLEESVGQRAIVMELVEGHEVAGPMPVDETLRIARQIAEAIEFAHEKGVVHRDLKPANIRVTPDGVVKVLDFGLAKAFEIADESSFETRLANSPTLSLAATHVGVVLGTAAYMSPEQAKGRPVDRRADVWAFGVVFYELLTGERLFAGETVSETLASVMKEPFSLDALPTDTPRPIRTLLARCLDRDLRRRLQSIGEARIVIEDVIAGVGKDDSSIIAAPQPRTWATWLWAVPVVALIGGAFWLGLQWRPSNVPDSAGVTRFALLPPEGTVLNFANSAGPHQAISPDGRYIAFVTTPAGSGAGSPGTLWVRALDSLVAQRLDRTEGAVYPFWSPDSQHLAYFANGQLMRIPVAGGAPLTVSTATSGEGGAWFQREGEEGIIVFAPLPTGPLHRVPARGGISTAVTKLANGEAGHIFPQFLPDGRLLYSARGDKGAIWAQEIGSAERTLVMEAETRAVYCDPGFLLYVRDGVLLAHRLNLATLALQGEPVAVAQDVRATASVRRSAFSVSTGVLVYRGGTSTDRVRIRWYERNGKRGELAHTDAGDFRNMELSPDGKYLAVQVGNTGEADLWIKDLSSGVFQRVTSGAGSENQEVWSPDSRRLAFVTPKGLFYTVIGSGIVTPVPGGEDSNLLEQWTPDGKYLLVRRLGNGPLSLLPAPPEGAATGGSAPAGTPKPQPIFTPAYDVDHFRVSPNGKWVAYTSLESGRAGVMVASFPSFTSRRQISIDQGAQPQWRADGRELFFHGDQVMRALDVDPDTMVTGRPRELFKTNPAVMSLQLYQYAATRDGQRFVLVEPAEDISASVEPIYVVANWRRLIGN